MENPSWAASALSVRVRPVTCWRTNGTSQEVTGELTAGNPFWFKFKPQNLTNKI